jgi:methionine transaminase
MVAISSKLPQVGTTIFTVMTQRANELGAINLSQGFPDFDPPPHLKELLNEPSQRGHHQYAPMTGVELLRERIAEMYANTYGKRVHAQNEITITLGATEAIFSAVLALVHPGDEVIVFDPVYDSYEPAITLAGGRTIHIPLLPPSFQVDWQQVRDAITPRTRMIMVNSPHNPATAVFSSDDVAELARLVRDTNILIIADEVYDRMVYDGRKHISLSAHAELSERTVSVFSFGKMLHATGWRVGYAIAPADLTREIRRVHQFNTFSIAAPLQYAIAEFITASPQHFSELSAFYQSKRDHFLSGLAGSRLKFTPTLGTFFQLIDYSEVSSQSDVEFADTLIRDAKVAAIPLSPFYANPPPLRYLRFCFAKNESTLTQACERLRFLVQPKCRHT